MFMSKTAAQEIASAYAGEGPGYDWTTARSLARELGGVEVNARYIEKSKRWEIGGWATPKDRHIVVAVQPQGRVMYRVLADNLQPVFHADEAKAERG
jgi:hypothetical protein